MIAVKMLDRPAIGIFDGERSHRMLTMPVNREVLIERVWIGHQASIQLRNFGLGLTEVEAHRGQQGSFQ